MSKTNILTLYSHVMPETKQIIFEFNKPLFENKFFQNKAGLIYNSIQIANFKNAWIQKPQQFAFEQYGNQAYYHIILLVNEISSIFKFDKPNLKTGSIIAPTKKTIQQILGTPNG